MQQLAAAALSEHLAEAFVRAKLYVAKHAERLPDARLRTLQVGLCQTAQEAFASS